MPEGRGEANFCFMKSSDRFAEKSLPDGKTFINVWRFFIKKWRSDRSIRQIE